LTDEQRQPLLIASLEQPRLNFRLQRVDLFLADSGLAEVRHKLPVAAWSSDSDSTPLIVRATEWMGVPGLNLGHDWRPLFLGLLVLEPVNSFWSLFSSAEIHAAPEGLIGRK